MNKETSGPNQGKWKLVMSGQTYWSDGYYVKKTFNVTGRNLFYDNTGPVTDQGSITVADESGTSPVIVPRAWNVAHTATALSEHDYPAGYKQIFNNLWKKNGQDDSNSLQISVTVTHTYEAQYYRAAGVIFTPIGGGKITVDGVTRTTSYTDYVRLNPSPAEQASGTAVNWNDGSIDYFFKYWTNSADTDTSYSTTVSFYPTEAITYSAHFGAKPLPPTDVTAGG